MFSKQIFNRLLQLKHRSVCCQHLFINRQVVEKTLAVNRCLSHVSEVDQNSQSIITEKIKDYANKKLSSKPMRNDLQEIDVNDEELWDLIGDRKIDALSDQPDYELLDEISPTLGVSFNLAAFADKSETLQNLIKLGVDLYSIENRNQKVAEYVLKLDFESEIKPYIRFLVDNGVSPEELGHVFTQNPLIFSQHMDDLKIRIKYLKSKKFTEQMITEVIRRAPKLLNCPTKRLDYQLGLLQKDFHLKADEIRELMTIHPKIAILHQTSYQVLLPINCHQLVL